MSPLRRLGFQGPCRECAGCGARAGIEVKALSPERGAKSWEEARSLPLYCMECNPRFFLGWMTRTGGDPSKGHGPGLRGLARLNLAGMLLEAEKIPADNRWRRGGGKEAAKKAREEG